MGLLRGLKWYRELCGLRGVCAIASYRMFNRPQVLAAIASGQKHPVYLRIGTSDFCAYRDVLVFRTKSYSPTILGFAPKTIVDVGAHIGMASIRFALEFPETRIIAVEPEAHNFSALRKNIAPYPTIVPICAALWKQDGEVTIGASNAHPKGTFQISEKGEQRVRAITMDTLMRENGIADIDLLKIDIEGSEKEIFESCPWVESVSVLAIELHDRIRSGCRDTVVAATGAFHLEHRGDVAIFIRSSPKDARSNHSAAKPTSACA